MAVAMMVVMAIVTMIAVTMRITNAIFTVRFGSNGM